MALTYWSGVVITKFGNVGAAFGGPTSAFNQQWNIVRIPYPTGDAHMGHAVQTYTTTLRSENITYSAYHMGYSNITADLARIRSLFPSPRKIAIWGSGLGGVGADCNLSQFHWTWPLAGTAELNNAGTPLRGVDAPVLSQIGRIWGAWHPRKNGLIVSDTCPVVSLPNSQAWSFALIAHFNQLAHPLVRKALTDDYSDATMSAFACIWGATIDPDGTCSTAVRTSLTSLLVNDIQGARNYKVFYHSLDCFSEREADGGAPEPSCDYDIMTQTGVPFSHWVKGWVGIDGFAWDNVQ